MEVVAGGATPKVRDITWFEKKTSHLIYLPLFVPQSSYINTILSRPAIMEPYPHFLRLSLQGESL